MKTFTRIILITSFFVSINSYGQPQCNAEFTYDSLNCPSISFLDNSIYTGGGGTIITWIYDFGDGNTSISQNPTHTYGANGTYYVCLSITSDDSLCLSTFCDSITISCIANLEENNFEEISLYPNPINSTLQVTYSYSNDLMYTVVALDGTIRLKGSQSNTSQLRIDVSQIETGMYYLLLDFNGTRFTKRFVKN